MKTRTAFFRMFVVIAIGSVLSCNKNSENPQNTITVESKDSMSAKINPLADVPMPAKLDSAMRQSFVKEAYQELKKLNEKNAKSFSITKENYLKMIDGLPANADRVSFSFVQFNAAKFPNKYIELAKFDGLLYMLYSYIDASGKNITGKTYAILSVEEAVEIPEADFNIMVDDYKTNIKPKIDRFVNGTQGNTLSVRIAREDLEAYKARMATKKNIGKLKITLAQWQAADNFLTKEQASAILEKLYYFADENIGQMTFITDCEDINGDNIEDLSGDDYNKLCPRICD